MFRAANDDDSYVNNISTPVDVVGIALSDFSLQGGRTRIVQ